MMTRNDYEFLLNDESQSQLIQYGYYSLLDKYSKPFFLNKKNIIKKSVLEDIIALKQFDRELRFILLKRIIQKEEKLRSIIAHKFDLFNPASEW